MSLASIYVAQHKAPAVTGNGLLFPLHVGSAVSRERLPGHRDDSGEQISKLNPYFCEMTGVYWAWKNDSNSQYVGLFHYRRYLDLLRAADLNSNSVRGKRFRGPLKSLSRSHGLTSLGFFARAAKEAWPRYFIPTPVDTRTFGYETNEEVFHRASGHVATDLKVLQNVLQAVDKELEREFRALLNSPILYPGNMFVMRRDAFHSYSEWIFPILFEVHQSLNYEGRSPQEKRAVGFLAERLTSMYLTNLVPDERKAHLNRVFWDPRPHQSS